MGRLPIANIYHQHIRDNYTIIGGYSRSIRWRVIDGNDINNLTWTCWVIDDDGAVPKKNDQHGTASDNS